MCGIAGIVNLDPRERVDVDRLTRMRDVLAHRGPDGEGLFIDGPVGLAHRRLAIIDLAAGQQPMANEDQTVWITFNGEIYNHAELRPELEARGHRYQSRSDTETILHLYEDEGEHALERLRGMFAFAIWDTRRKTLLLARDRLGIKPLYYAMTGKSLFFASEIKGILAAGSIRAALNEDALPEFLATRFLSGDDTFFRGVQKLLPGHLVTWSPGEAVAPRRYWQVPFPAEHDDRTPAAAATDLRAMLERAVESHLMSDVPLGAFLSGGLDSTALAALMTRARRDPIQTFAVGFDDRATSELPYARLAASSLGATHRDVTVSAAEFFAALPKLVWQEDEPIAFPSSVPLYFVSRLARDHVKVVLTGEGADELFLGYNRYRVTMWNARLGRPYWTCVPRGIRQRVRRIAGTLPARFSRYARRTFIALEPGFRDLYLENFAVIPIGAQARLLAGRGRFAARDPYAVEHRCYANARGTMLDRLAQADLQTYLPELLMKQDQMSMAASIESRVPFLDDRLVAHVASLPSHLKLSTWETKVLFRAAVRDLVPPAILSRPKMGFPVPLGRWFRESHSRIVHELVLGPRAARRGLFEPAALGELAARHQADRTANADALWLLANLEIWSRVFVDGEDPAHVLPAAAGRAPQWCYANPLGENGRPLAADERRTRPQPADRVAALAAPRAHAADNQRAG